MPKAYVIADVQVTDPDRYKNYTALSPQAVAAAGGRFVVRGGQTQVLEGNWEPGRVVVIEFDDIEPARRFYESDLYRQARTQRAGATQYFNMILVEGVSNA